MLNSCDLDSSFRLSGQSGPSRRALSTRRSVSSIPVFSQYGFLGHVEGVHAHHYACAPNAEIRRRNGKITRIHLHDYGNDYALPERKVQDKDMIHNHETDTNPPRVWEFQKLCPA